MCVRQRDAKGGRIAERLVEVKKGLRWMAAYLLKKVDGRLLLQRWINRPALSLLGSANLVAEVDRPLLLTRGVEPQCSVTPWLRKLDRFGALPKSIFEHCVSPSPPGKRARPG